MFKKIRIILGVRRKVLLVNPGEMPSGEINGILEHATLPVFIVYDEESRRKAVRIVKV